MARDAASLKNGTRILLADLRHGSGFQSLVNPEAELVHFGRGQFRLAGRHLTSDDFVDQQTFGCSSSHNGRAGFATFDDGLSRAQVQFALGRGSSVAGNALGGENCLCSRFEVSRGFGLEHETAGKRQKEGASTHVVVATGLTVQFIPTQASAFCGCR
jgi:hypothetical protein